ncbi:MAG: peptide chain release factor N(5)-glutamine methyltransferase [Mogibacterium sp.]|nr:peptide chain release factor N(5)-glutamine methyltransferase [Mogibacterium sp.]
MAKIDYSKIFIKNACPTSIGGQAVMEGVMMQGNGRVALAMRMPSGELYLKTSKKKSAKSAWMKIPFLRGIFSFVSSLIMGMGTLMESADILEMYAPEQYAEEPGKLEKWMNDRFGRKTTWNFLMTMAIVFAVAITLLFFVILPTWVVNFLGKWISSAVVLNLIEGVLRIVMFVLYVVAIRRMEDIKTLFRYHGAEHKSIHCFENGLELTPENADGFYTLHPRCGTSFLVFVLIISLLLFSFLGWPNLLWRITSRILLIPVIAGISYELLKWAGRSDGKLVRILSYPGLMLQKLTTAEPTLEQLEVGLLALKAVLVDPSEPMIEGFVDADGKLINEFNEEDFLKRTLAEQKDNIAEPTLRIEKKDLMASDEKPTLKEVIEAAQEKLMGIENGGQEALYIFNYATGLSRSELITKRNNHVSENVCREYNRLIEERLSGKPLQYIVGTQPFMGLLFRVNPSVLIPRMDTEVLVEKVINIIRHKGWENPEILDMCCGSGCIGISLADRFPGAHVTMTDVSADALRVAAGNARINNVSDRCRLLIGNMFEALSENDRYDVITCNPPYIESAVIETLSTEVKDHEPRLALDGGEDGLKFYRLIAENAEKHLTNGGILAMEIGADQREAVEKLFRGKRGYEGIASFKDLAGLDRVVIVMKHE